MRPVRMPDITRQYKDILQRRLMILMSLNSKFTRYMRTNNYSHIARFDKLIAKIKWCSFFASQCTVYNNMQHLVYWLLIELVIRPTWDHA